MMFDHSMQKINKKYSKFKCSEINEIKKNVNHINSIGSTTQFIYKMKELKNIYITE